MSPRYLIRAMTLLIAVFACKPAAALLQGCSVSSTGVTFGAYDPSSSIARDGVGSITVTCTVTLLGVGASWDIAISPGISGSFTTRNLSSGASLMHYNLFTDAARTTLWGDGTGGTSKVSDSQLLLVGTSIHTYSVYGQIAPLQNLPPGTYSDSLTATLNYN